MIVELSQRVAGVSNDREYIAKLLVSLIVLQFVDTALEMVK